MRPRPTETTLQDGIDWTAFSARLKTMPPERRRHTRHELSRWMREASRASRISQYLGFIIVVVAVALGSFAIFARPHERIFVPSAFSVLMIGAWVNMHAATRARRWRRLHPFEQWRTE